MAKKTLISNLTSGLFRLSEWGMRQSWRADAGTLEPRGHEGRTPRTLGRAVPGRAYARAAAPPRSRRADRRRRAGREDGRNAA